jgi:molybdopterin molybdotransferase
VGQVAVVAQPKAAVIATGKELVTEAAQALESGQIRDSNRPFGRPPAPPGAEVVWKGWSAMTWPRSMRCWTRRWPPVRGC